MLIYQVTVKQIPDGRYAAFERDHSFWEFGTTAAEALAKLVATYPRYEFHVTRE